MANKKSKYHISITATRMIDKYWRSALLDYSVSNKYSNAFDSATGQRTRDVTNTLIKYTEYQIEIKINDENLKYVHFFRHFSVVMKSCGEIRSSLSRP